MGLTPFLVFNGRCDEALAFSGRAVGAKVRMKMTFGECPDKPEIPLPPGWETKVMHSEACIAETPSFASDGMSNELQPFGGFSLALNLPDLLVQGLRDADGSVRARMDGRRPTLMWRSEHGT